MAPIKQTSVDTTTIQLSWDGKLLLDEVFKDWVGFFEYAKAAGEGAHFSVRDKFTIFSLDVLDNGNADFKRRHENAKKRPALPSRYEQLHWLELNDYDMKVFQRKDKDSDYMKSRGIPERHGRQFCFFRPRKGKYANQLFRFTVAQSSNCLYPNFTELFSSFVRILLAGRFDFKEIVFLSSHKRRAIRSLRNYSELPVKSLWARTKSLEFIGFKFAARVCKAFEALEPMVEKKKLSFTSCTFADEGNSISTIQRKGLVNLLLDNCPIGCDGFPTTVSTKKSQFVVMWDELSTEDEARSFARRLLGEFPSGLVHLKIIGNSSFFSRSDRASWSAFFESFLSKSHPTMKTLTFVLRNWYADFGKGDIGIHERRPSFWPEHLFASALDVIQNCERTSMIEINFQGGKDPRDFKIRKELEEALYEKRAIRAVQVAQYRKALFPLVIGMKASKTQHFHEYVFNILSQNADIIDNSSAYTHQIGKSTNNTNWKPIWDFP